MQEFDNFEKVSALFTAKGFPENAKYCVMWKNLVSKDPLNIGGMINSMEHPYNAILVGFCDAGIAFFHLNAHGPLLVNLVKKLELVPSTYTFVPAANIKAVKVARWAPLNNRVKAIDLQIANGNGYISHRLMLNPEEKPLAYQKLGYTAFVEKYAAK